MWWLVYLKDLHHRNLTWTIPPAITAFSPLLRYNAGPNTRIGIIGIGGIGHFGILGAKALGCKDIIAISRTSSKKEDAMKMGATGFIATDEEAGWADKHAATLDLIVSTGKT